MASAKFLEEALSTDVDESAVNAIVGSLEDQLVTSGPNRNSSSGILNPAPACSDDRNTNEFAVSNEDSQNSINSANSVTSLHSSDSTKIVQSSYVPSPSAPSLQNSPMNTSHNNTPTAYINPMQQKANEVKMIYPTTTQALVNQQMINSRVTYPQSLPSGSIGLAPLSQAVLHTTTPVNKTIGIQQNLVIKQAGGGIPAGLVSMPMSVTSSIPGVVTLSKPAGQTTQTISGQPTLLANVPILNMRPPNNPHKTVATVSPRVVLGAPTQMMQSRPSTPGITLQTLPGLPPGQQGHLLLKTENGQYQLLRVGPAPAQNALGTPPPQALRLSTVPAQSGVATVSTTGPGQVSVPIQGSVQGQLQQQSQQQSQQQMQQQSQQQMQQQSQQQTQQQTQHQGIVQNAPSNLTPVQASGLAPVSVASVAQKTSDNTKEKCRNFLANLLDLSSREPVTVERNVRTLIQELIDNKVEPEQFCDRLERLLKASPQPCLIGFLKKSLPLLRQSLIAKELVIEGIQAPPPQALYGNPPTSQMVSSHMNIVSQNTMPVTSMNIQQNRTMTVMAPGRMQAHTNPSSPVTLQPPALVQAVQSQAMNVHPNQSQQASPPTYNPQYPVQYTQVSVSDINFNPDELLQAQVRPMGRGPSPSGGKGPTGSVIVPSMQGPTKVINRSQPKPNLHNAGGSTKSSFPKSAAAMSSPSSTVSSKSGQREKDKKQTAATFAQAYADIDKMAADDDINDVAAMGGVNLAEESQRILGSTEMIGTQIRSCKDEYFLNMTALQARIKSYCVKRGLEEPSIEVSGLISHAVQERLKTVMSKLAVIAEHRIDLTKPEPGYEVTKDLKSQLKFLEELDRVEKKRREDSEREMLLRAAKSRSKNEDPEQAKLKAKAKELQRVEMEEIRQREANLTALQAIGPRKKPKLDLPNSSTSSDQNSGTTSTNNGGQNQASSNSGPNNVPVRSRLKRVNVRDLIFLLESEKDLKNTSLLYRAYLK